MATVQADPPPSNKRSPQDRLGLKGSDLLRSTGVVSGITLLSRVLGLVRDVVLAQFFGAGIASDAFFVAFKIPNFLRRLFAEGAFAQAFVPVLSQYRAQNSEQEVRELVSATAGVLSGLLFILTLFCVLAAPLLVWIFAPGFSQQPEKMELTAQLLRWTFPYLFCIANVALAAAILNAHGHFAIPAAAPIVLNMVLISCALIAPEFSEPVMVLGWGVLLAGVLQLCLQLPALARRSLLVWPRLNWRHPGVKQIGRLMLPALFGVSVSQISLLLDTILASVLVSGSVSWLYYADRLMELPLGVFGIAIGTVILPRLSQQHSAQSPEDFSASLGWGLRMVFLLGAPASLALCILAEPILATLFQYKAFTPEDTQQSAVALRAYSLGVVAFMLVKVLAPGFFARQDTRTPVKIAVIAMSVNMVLNLVLIWPLAHAGLALATSLSASLNAFLLFLLLKRQGVYRHQPLTTRFLVCVFLATVVMGGVLWWFLPPSEFWYAANLWVRCGGMLGLILAGGGVYLVLLWLLGLRPRMLLSS